MVQEESTLNMLFYSGFFVMLFSAIPTIYVWSSPTIKDLALLFILGITGNLILYCLLKSFKLVEISSVAPYRYIELTFSAAFGYIIFGEVPHITTIVGAIIIIFSTLLLIYETFLPKLAVNKIIIFFNKD
ncbi:EamA family transporter [Candidatus Tisiphia endosymbiont of Mystacides longicornis]